MKRLAGLLALVLSLALGSCRDNLPPAAEPADFRGILWRLESIVTNGETLVIEAATPISLQFEATTLAGVGPCSRHTATYSASNGTISITAFAPGDASCAYESLQAIYYDGLKSAESYLSTETTLRLFADGGATVLNYARATTAPPIDTTDRNLPLPGTGWRLRAIQQNNVLDELDSAIVVTLLFKDDERFEGAGLCSGYDGDYTADTLALDVTRISGLVRECPFDERYHSMLDRARSYRSTNTELRIVTDREVLYYARVRDIDPPVSAPIENKEWRLRTIRDGSRREHVETPFGISIAFLDGGKYVGLGACNRYDGTYEIDGSAIAIRGPMSWDLLCPQRDVERRYFEHLGNAARYLATDTTLRIVTRRGAVLIYGEVPRGSTRPPATDTILRGSRWKLQRVELTGSSRPAPTNPPTTLVFEEQGVLKGSGVCMTTISGRYLQNGRSLSITIVNKAERPCADSDFEHDYFDALERARSYQISFEGLRIETDHGVLYYTRHR
jgi:heat shock protein HslJ